MNAFFFKFLTHSEQKPPRKVKVLCKFSMPMDKSFATWGTVTHIYNTVFQKLGGKMQKYCIISRQKDILQNQKLIDF